MLRSGGEHCRQELAVEVRWGGVVSVGNTAIGSLPLRSGGEHCHRELLVGNTAIGLWLRSGACGWGSVGKTAIGSLRLRSGGRTAVGGEHCYRERAVEVRWGTLPSGACG